MPTVRLSFSPAPVHVRTARLVGVAVARRAGVSDRVLEEIRQAIGEACTRAVALHQRHHLADPILIEMIDSPGYIVSVTDRAPVVEAVSRLEDTAVAELSNDGLSEEAVAAEMALALLTGLVDDLQVRPAAEGPGTEVRMAWPAWRPGR